MRRIIILCALLFSAALAFAGLGNITLTNVGFNGDIGPVGSDATEEGRSWVKIQGKEGSVYRIKPSGGQSKNHISEVNLSGSGTVEFHDCDIEGPITILGDVTVSFIRCTLQSEVNASGHSSGKLTFSGTTIPSLRVGGNHEIVINTASTLKGNVKAETGFTGKFTMTDSNFLTGTAPDLNFKEKGLTSFVVRNNSGNIGKVLLNDTGLTTFTLQNSGSIGEIDLTRVNNSNVRSTIADCKDAWNVAVLKISECGLTGAFSIDNAAIGDLDISNNEITSLTVNADHHSNNLKILDASGNSIASADIWMITDSSNPKSTLNLSGNRLGSSGSLETYIVSTLRNQTSDSRPTSSTGTDCGVVYHRYSNISQEEIEPEWDDEEGEWVGGGVEYTYDDESFMYFRVGRNLTLNGNHITTYFWGGRDWTSDTISGILTGKNSNTPNWPSGRISGSSQTVTFDFSAEWSSLLALDVNLQNNGIEYTAGFKTSSGVWDTWIKFKVRTGKLATDLHIGSMTPSSGGSNSQQYDAYIAIDGTAAANQLWNLPDTGGDGEKYFKLTDSGTRFTTAISPNPGTGWNMNTQTIYSLHEHTFIIHRWKSYGGIGANTLRGLDMYIHPFGDSSIPAH